MTPRGALLYLPPFAEEANRSRRMAVLQARRLAARGWPVLLLDPFGTGDSAGAFHEARWELWLADAAQAAAWLATRWPGGSVTLWGLRLGALLAAALAARIRRRTWASGRSISATKPAAIWEPRRGSSPEMLRGRRSLVSTTRAPTSMRWVRVWKSSS